MVYVLSLCMVSLFILTVFAPPPSSPSTPALPLTLFLSMAPSSDNESNSKVPTQPIIHDPSSTNATQQPNQAPLSENQAAHPPVQSSVPSYANSVRFGSPNLISPNLTNPLVQPSSCYDHLAPLSLIWLTLWLMT